MFNTSRRRGLSSVDDVQQRRRSEMFFARPVNPNIAEARTSAQIPSDASFASSLSPVSTAPTPSNLHISNLSSDTPPAPAVERPLPPPIQTENAKHRRFSLMKIRNASDPQLSARAKLEASEAPPRLPKPPEIIKTAPTGETSAKPVKKKSRMRLPGRTKTSTDSSTPGPFGPLLEDLSIAEKKERRKTMSEGGTSRSRVTFDQPDRPVTQGRAAAPPLPPPPLPPPAYGDESGSALAIPVNRLSESSRSDGSSASRTDNGVYGSTTTTTTHIVSTTTTFFRLPRRKKPGPLFPLPAKVNGNDSSRPSFTNARPSSSPAGEESAAVSALRHPQSAEHIVAHPSSSPLPSPSRNPKNPLARASMTFAAPGPHLMRNDSKTSNPSSPRRKRAGLRDRSSTRGSASSAADDQLPHPGLPSSSTRTSTSTGRKSFGDLFGLSSRLRQNSEPPHNKHPSGPATPGSTNPKGSSMQLAREPLVIPDRLDDDTPAKYLVRLEAAVSCGVVASVLSRGSDPFSQAALRSYMRGFAFFGDPLDMAIRKLLMEVELPKETQHIDRCLQAFANRYHECNPGIYGSPDQAYFVAFSLLILHTDLFNKNNKHKMQKADYLKNTQNEGVADDILEYFHDNISYTPFIHVEDDLDINGERIVQHKMKKKSMLFPRTSPDSSRRNSKEPIDPYTLIIDGKLDTLRPNLKDVMNVEEHYNYLGTAKSLDLPNLQRTFFKTGVLQIVSARSRPDAFMTERTVSNPDEAHPGIVDIKITKVGLLWRKDAKKKKTRSPWQEWGAILTGAQLYFFRNTTWIKSLMHQQETHQKQVGDGTPVIFKPPLESFKPDALMSTDDSVALMDSTYTKHKNAFVFVRHGGFEEVFLADNQDEMNDWLAKLNYAAAFRTSGVRMRGVVGGNHANNGSRGFRRLETPGAGQTIQTPTGDVTIVSGRIDTQMANDILAARREIMLQKIADSEEKLASAQKQLDNHLRNARHLQILAPIQARTRDQVLLAAGRMAAKLKWLRMEMWRLICHRDILSMDLEEEERLSRPDGMHSRVGTLDRPDTTQTAKQPVGISTPQGSPRSAGDSTEHSRPATQPSIEKEQIPETLQRVPSCKAEQGGAWELPQLASDGRSRQMSVCSSPQSLYGVPPLVHRSSQQSFSQADNPLPETPPQIDAAEQEILHEHTPESKLGRHETPGKKETDEAREQVEASGGGTEKSRDKIRRSLHRTLRDAQHHVPGSTHHRGRKGKESSSTIGTFNEENDDILVRKPGSFVVHGKKASVITFGTELQSMSAEERLRFRHANKDPSSAPPKLENDFNSVLVEPVEFHERGERRESNASCSTATARSFRDLHRRLSELVSEDEIDFRSDVVSLASDPESASSSLVIPKMRHGNGRGSGSMTAIAMGDGPEESRGSSRGDESSGEGKGTFSYYSPDQLVSPTLTGFPAPSALGAAPGPDTDLMPAGGRKFSLQRTNPELKMDAEPADDANADAKGKDVENTIHHEETVGA